MAFEKDIRFPEKKVDLSWKDQIDRDRTAASAAPASGGKKNPADIKSSPDFMNFLKSLATQALMSLGEIPHPMTGQREVDLGAAKEMIDLLSVLKEKTEGNCSPEESAIFNSLLPELQIKFSRQS